MIQKLVPTLLLLGAFAGIASVVLAAGDRDRIAPLICGMLLIPGMSMTVVAIREVASRGLRDALSDHQIRLVVLLPLATQIGMAFFVSPFDPALWAILIHLSIALAVSGSRIGLGKLPNWVPQTFVLVLATFLLLTIGAEGGLRLISIQQPKVLFTQRDEDGASRLRKLRRSFQARFGTPMNTHGGFDREFEPVEGQGSALLLGDEYAQGLLPTALVPSRVAERTNGQWQLWDLTLFQSGPPEYRSALDQYLDANDGGPAPDAVRVVVSLADDLLQCDRRDDDWRGLALILDARNALVPSLLGKLTDVGSRMLVHREEFAGETSEARLEEIPERHPWVDDPSQQKETLDEVVLRMKLDRQVDAILRSEERNTRRRLLDDLQAMEQSCRARGIGFGVLVLPHRLEVDDAFRAEFGIDAKPLAECRRALVEQLDDRGTGVLDLFPVLRASSTARGGDLYHPGDLRLNKLGADVVGRTLGADLGRR